MTIHKTLEGKKLTLALEGRLDTMTAPQLEQELEQCLDGLESLVFDFSQLEYISSAGLRVLLMAQKKMDDQGTMVIQNVNDSVMEVFELTGFADKVLTIK